MLLSFPCLSFANDVILELLSYTWKAGGQIRETKSDAGGEKWGIHDTSCTRNERESDPDRESMWVFFFFVIIIPNIITREVSFPSSWLQLQLQPNKCQDEEEEERNLRREVQQSKDTHSWSSHHTVRREEGKRLLMFLLMKKRNDWFSVRRLEKANEFLVFFLTAAAVLQKVFQASSLARVLSGWGMREREMPNVVSDKVSFSRSALSHRVQTLLRSWWCPLLLLSICTARGSSGSSSSSSREREHLIFHWNCFALLHGLIIFSLLAFRIACIQACLRCSCCSLAVLLSYSSGLGRVESIINWIDCRTLLRSRLFLDVLSWVHPVNVLLDGQQQLPSLIASTCFKRSYILFVICVLIILLCCSHAESSSKKDVLLLRED